MMRTKNQRRGRTVRSLLIAAPVLGMTGYLIYDAVRRRKALDDDHRWQGRSGAPGSRWDGRHGLGHEGPVTRPAMAPIDASRRFDDLIGRKIVGMDDSTLGAVEGVYYRSLSGQPEWVATSIGTVDPRRVLIPLDGATMGDEVRVGYNKEIVDKAPSMDAQVLEEEQEMLLYSHYGARRDLPGVEAQRDSDNLRLRMWPDDGALKVQED